MGATALSIIKSNYEARTSKMTELRSIDEAAVGDDGAPRAYSPEEEAQITELRSDLEAIDSRISAQLAAEIRSAEITDAMGSLAGILTDRESGDVVDTRSMGQRVLGNDDLRSWVEGGARGTSPVTEAALDYRAVTDITTSGQSALGRAERLSRIGNDFLDRRTFLLDLLPTIPVSYGSVEYVQDQTALADSADKAQETVEGGEKGQAGLTPVVITEPVATIPVLFQMTRQAAADFPQLQGYLDGRGRYALKRRADKQAINGDGVNPNLKGLLQRTGIVTYAPGSEARYKSIRSAITAMEQVEAVPEIIVLNPADAELFDLANHASAGLHATPDEAGGLRQSPSRTAWGLTQVHSTAITSGTAMLIDPMAVAVFDRQQVTSYMTDSHNGNFALNILTLLLEMRIGLGLFDPAGVCKVTFNGTT